MTSAASEVSSTEKPSGRPSAVAWRRSARWATEWKVPPSTRVGRRGPDPCSSSAVVRATISRAARRVKVSRRMRSAGVPVAASHATREVRVVVLPVPAPATMRRAPPSNVAAARWSSLS
jgi:hypothetical protein